MGRTFVRPCLWPVVFTCSAVSLACEAQERDFDTAVAECESAECPDGATSDPEANPSAAGSDGDTNETDGTPSGSAVPDNPTPGSTMVVSVPSAGPIGPVMSTPSSPGAGGNSGTGGAQPAPDETEPGGAGAGNPVLEPDAAPSATEGAPTVPAMTGEASGGAGPTPTATDEPMNGAGGEANAGGSGGGSSGNDPGGNGGSANGGEPGNGGAPSVEPVGGCDAQLLYNANFDQGVTSWESESTWEGLDTIVPASDSGLLSHNVAPHSGGYLAWLGGTPDDPESLHRVSISQDVSIPEDATAVTFSGVIQIKTLEPDPDVYDSAYAQLEVGDTTLFQFKIWTNVDAASGWVPFEYTTTDVSDLHGKQVVFWLQANTDHDLTTHFWFDSLRLEADCDR
jgi:hypothetical protein